MGTGFAKKKKQAKAMQEQLSKLQDDMKNAAATGSAGGGMVEVTLNGQYELVNLKIKKECVDPEDVEGLVDLIKVSFNDAHQKLKATQTSPLQGFPGLSGFGF